MYYRLTYISSSDKSRVGDSMFNGNKPLNIGQGATCDVLLPESEQYEPELFASILSAEDTEKKSVTAGGWYVVRRTDSHQILVNGEEVGMAQVLASGDILSFVDGENRSELKFEVFDDGEYDPGSGIVYKKHESHRRYFAAVIGLAVFALGIAAYAIFAPHRKDLRHEDLSQITQSVYHITVDSVYLLCDTEVDGQHRMVVVDSIELSSVAEGTAFLTSDSLFVTARHCVEPWINDEEWDGVSSKSKMAPEVRLATKAETENRAVGYEKYVLRAHCVISKGFDRYDCYSTDFIMNKSRDMVIRLGSFQEPIYWRTIMPIAHRRDMELGDFAYIKAETLKVKDIDSQISLAGWEELIEFARPGDHDVAVIGYPLNDNKTDDASILYGSLMEFGDELSKGEGCIRISADINPGNSGGPVFAKIGDEIKVIGIVSKADGRASQGMFWAVPTTEVVAMKNRGKNKIVKDSVTYRR